MKLNIVEGLQHIGISTSEIEQTVNFYEKLDFEILLSTKNPNTDKKVVFVGYKDLILEIYEDYEMEEGTGAINHIALSVKNINIARMCMIEKGLCPSEIKTLPFWENGISFFKIKGVNQEIIEFCQKK